MSNRHRSHREVDQELEELLRGIDDLDEFVRSSTISLDEACAALGLSFADEPPQNAQASAPPPSKPDGPPNPYTVEGIRQILNPTIRVKQEMRPVKQALQDTRAAKAAATDKPKPAVSSETAFARSVTTPPAVALVPRDPGALSAPRQTRNRALTAPASTSAGPSANNQVALRSHPARQQATQQGAMVPHQQAGYPRQVLPFNNLSRDVELAASRIPADCADFSFSGNFVPGGYGVRVRSQSQSIRHDTRTGQTVGRYNVHILQQDTRGRGQVYKDNAEMQGSADQVSGAMQALYFENNPRRIDM